MRKCCLIEEQFNLPSRLVDLRNRQGGKGKIVCEELQSLIGLLVDESDTAQGIGIDLDGFQGRENNSVIGPQAGGLVDRTRITPLQENVLFSPYDEKRRRHFKNEEPLKIDVPTVHYVERTGFRKNLVEDVHIVDLAIRNVDERRNVPMQID